MSILKIFATSTYQKITEALVEFSAENGAIDEPAQYGNEHLDALAHFWLSRPATIYGGSSEVQRKHRGQAGSGFAGLIAVIASEAEATIHGPVRMLDCVARDEGLRLHQMQ